MKFWLLLVLLITLSLADCFSQKKVTLSGHVTEAASGEYLSGAVVLAEGIDNTGAVTNAYGFYSLTVPEGNYRILYKFIGFETRSLEIDLRQNQSIRSSHIIPQRQK